MPKTIRIGTRGSELALWQANHVADLLREEYPETSIELVTFTTKGDVVLDKSLPAIGGKGLFTQELETALLSGEIDCAVHSLKDLPTESPQGLTIGAVPKRAPVNDVLISKHGLLLDDLPQGAKIGTSSLRRAAQLRHYRPDLQMLDIRGNVPTRIKKALDPNSEYAAIILAQAGLERLGLMQHVSQILPLEIMLPAPAQGAIAIQCVSSEESQELFSVINHLESRLAVEAERRFLNRLDGGCSVPVAALSYPDEHNHILRGRVVTVDGAKMIDISKVLYPSGSKAPTSFDEHELNWAWRIGDELASEALEKGAAEILAEVKHES